MAEELVVVGKSLLRIDGLEKVTGRTKYAGDIGLSGMLYGKILRSPYAHAKIKKIDTSKVERLPGVKAVLTHKDVPKVLIGEVFGKDAYVLEDRVRFVGDEVAAVAAIDPYTALDALDLIEVEYEPLPAVFTIEDALKADAPIIPPPAVFELDAPLWFHPGTPDTTEKTNLSKQKARYVVVERGKLERGFQEADLVMEDTYKTNFVVHVPMEPRACVAYWEDGKLTVRAPSQMIYWYRRSLAEVLGIPMSKVRAISPPIGGSFGGKYEGRYGFIAALLARKTGRPVRIEFSREEEFLAKMRQASIIELKVGVKKDGTITAIHSKLTADSGGYDWSIESEGSVPTCGLTRCPNVKYEGYSVYTNHPPTGEMRGVTNLMISFALAQHFDRMAEQLGIDTVEFMLKNAIRTGDLCASFWEREGTVLSSCGLDDCIKKGADRIGWKEAKKRPKGIDQRKRRGMGMMMMTHHSAWTSSVSSAIVKIVEDGTAHLLMGASEQGQGITTTTAQIVSEVLGIPIEDVAVTTTDTETETFDVGTVGSIASHLTAMAVKLATEDAKSQLLKLASERLELSPEDLDIRDRQIYVKEAPDRKVAIKDITGGWPLPIIIGKATWQCPSWPSKARCFGAHFAEVEVDIYTGEVKVLKYVAVHDVGKALNPKIVEGQIDGSVVMGVGMALMEELVFDKESGKAINPNLGDYKVYSASETLKIESFIVEPVDPLGPYGAKGFAEGATIPAPGAIANAIYDAIGVRFNELPITPDKILKALKNR